MSSSIEILPVNYTLQFPACGGGLSEEVECRLDLVEQVPLLQSVTRTFLEESLKNVLGDAGRGGFEKLELTTSYWEELDVKSDRRRQRVRKMTDLSSRRHRHLRTDGGAPMTARLHYTGVAKFRYTAPSNPQQHIEQIIRFAFIREWEKLLQEIKTQSRQVLTNSNSYMCSLEEVSMGNWTEALDRLSPTQVRNCSGSLLKGVADPLSPRAEEPVDEPSKDDGMGIVIMASVGGIVVAVAALFVAFMLSKRGQDAKKPKKRKKKNLKKNSNNESTQLQTIDVDGDLAGEDPSAGPYVRQKPMRDEDSDILPPSVLKNRDEHDDFESTGGSTIKPLPSRPDSQRCLERGISGNTSVSDLSWDNRGKGDHFDIETRSRNEPPEFCVASEHSRSDDEEDSSRRRHSEDFSSGSSRSMDTTDKLSALLLKERPAKPDCRGDVSMADSTSEYGSCVSETYSRRGGRGKVPRTRGTSTASDGNRSTNTSRTNDQPKYEGDLPLGEAGRPERRCSASSRNSATQSRSSQRGRRKRVRVGQSRRLGPGGRRRSFADAGSVDSACFSTESQGEAEPHHHKADNVDNVSALPDGSKLSDGLADEARGDVRWKEEDTDYEKTKRDGVSSKSLMSCKSLLSADETVDEDREREYGSKNTISTASMTLPGSQYSVPLNADRVPENDELSMSAFSINSKASSLISHKIKKERKQIEDMALRKIMTTRKVVSDIDGISETSNFRRALGFAGAGTGGGNGNGYAPSEGGGSDIAGGNNNQNNQNNNMDRSVYDASVDSSQLDGPLERAAFERMMYVRTISKRSGPRR